MCTRIRAEQSRNGGCDQAVCTGIRAEQSRNGGCDQAVCTGIRAEQSRNGGCDQAVCTGIRAEQSRNGGCDQAVCTGIRAEQSRNGGIRYAHGFERPVFAQREAELAAPSGNLTGNSGIQPDWKLLCLKVAGRLLYRAEAILPFLSMFWSLMFNALKQVIVLNP